MLRSFILTTRKLLVPRPLPVYTLTSDATSSSLTAIYDVRRNPRVAEHPYPPGHPLLGGGPPLLSSVRWQSTAKKDFQVPDLSVIACNLINMLKCVDLQHLNTAPPPAFWVAVIAGGSQVAFPLLELIGGYCNTVTILQLQLAAMTVGFLGGIKWGLATSKNPVPEPNWDSMKWAITPTAVALMGLTLPYPLAFLVVGGAVVSTLYLDLKSCALPPWANAIRLFLAITTLAGLLMALIAYLLFHNKANEKKKEENKDKKKGGGKEDEEDEEDDKSKKKGKDD